MTSLRHSFDCIQKMPTAFWVVIIVTLINQLGNMAMVFLVAYLTIHFHFSLPSASLVYASLCGSLLVSGIFAGAIADFFGPPRVMAVVLCTNAVVLLCMPFLHEFLSIELMCIVWGTVFGIYRPAAQTFLTHIVPRDSYKVTFSIYRLAWNLGMSIGPAIGGYLAVHSFQLIFIFNGCANILAGLVLILGLIYKPGVDHQPPAIHSSFKPTLGLKYLKQDLALRLFVIGMIPVTMIFYQNASTMPVFINQNLHLPLSVYGLLFTLNTLLIVVFELPVNIATLSWPPRRSLAVGSLLISLGFSGLLFASATWHLFVLTAIWSAGEMILFPAASSYIAELAPETSRGNYISIYTTSINLGLLIGPWSGALIMHHFSANSLWLTCLLWGIISIVLFQYLRPPNYDKLRP